MKNFSKWLSFGFLALACLILTMIWVFLSSDKSYPEETTYFSLLGAAPEEIDVIEFYYAPQGLPESYEPRLVRTLTRENPETAVQFKETIAAFDCHLKKITTASWDEMKQHFQIGSMQAVFCAGAQKYTLPVLDVYERGISGALVDSWVLADGAQLYEITDLPKSRTESDSFPYDRGLGTRLFHYAGYQSVYDAVLENYNISNPYADLPVLSSPLLYLLDLPAGPLAGYADSHQLQDVFAGSSDVFSGEIIRINHAPHEIYQIRIDAVFKGALAPGDEVSFYDHKGYFPDAQSYSIRNYDSERALREKNTYLFFMQPKRGGVYDTEPLSLTPSDRYYGICEIIDGRVWPLCNTKPDTAWVQGETLEELMLRLQPNE